MKIKLLSILFTIAVIPVWAQQAPSSLSCRTSPTAIELSWEQSGFDKTTLFNESELITHHGVGYAGSDVSMYRYQTVGVSAYHQANFKVAEDFTLFDYDEEYDAAYVSDLVFYVFPQTFFDYTESPVTEVFVEIYDNSPMDGGQLIYSTNANVKRKTCLSMRFDWHTMIVSPIVTCLFTKSLLIWVWFCRRAVRIGLQLPIMLTKTALSQRELL